MLRSKMPSNTGDGRAGTTDCRSSHDKAENLLVVKTLANFAIDIVEVLAITVAVPLHPPALSEGRRFVVYGVLQTFQLSLHDSNCDVEIWKIVRFCFASLLSQNTMEVRLQHPKEVKRTLSTT
jgi:hypothetical protein